jgi:hypothetical protein
MPLRRIRRSIGMNSRLDKGYKEIILNREFLATKKNQPILVWVFSKWKEAYQEI